MTTTWICLPAPRDDRPKRARRRGRPFVLDVETRQRILQMLREGHRECEIVRQLKIKRHHVRNTMLRPPKI